MHHAFKALIFNQEFRSSQFFFYRKHVKHKAFFHDQVTVLSIKGTKQTCPWKAQTWHKNLRLTQVNTKAKGIQTQNNSCQRQSMVEQWEHVGPVIQESAVRNSPAADYFSVYLDKSLFILQKKTSMRYSKSLGYEVFGSRKKFK